MSSNNNPPPPDTNAELARLDNMKRNSGNGKPAYLFGVIPLEMNATGPFAMQSLSPLAKNVPTLFQGTGKANGVAAKFLEAIQSIPKDLADRAQKAGVMYMGDLPSGSPHGHGGGGGGFVPNLTNSGGGSIDLG